jgi:hypothetical protein
MNLENLADVVTVLGFFLAFLAFAVDQWDKKRRRFVLATGVLMMVLGLALAKRDGPVARTPDGGGVPDGRAPPVLPPGTRGVADTSIAVSDTPSAVQQTPIVADPPYHGWLRKQQLVIRYNAAMYMAGSCPGRIMAVGDFSTGGWTSGPEAQCDPDGWISFDAGQLVSAPRFVVGKTYCLNFVDEQGRYGLHGSPPRASGLSTIELPAKEGAEVGLNIGFRIVEVPGGTHALEFTNAGAAHCE